MSDDEKSLEDFFAKKAKGKKQKKKSKFTTSDTITKQVGSSQKENEIKSKDLSGKKTSGVTTVPSNPNDEEWIDFREPTEKDYSGLRIQSLQIGTTLELNVESDCNYLTSIICSEADSSIKKEKTAGPWQQVASSSSSSQVSAAPQEEAKSVGVYRPPVYRAPGRRFPVGKSKTPEIDSEIAFPSLAASMATNKSKESNDKNFEPVKHGSRTQERLSDHRPQLDLENKFDALGRK
ncbi:Protein CDV3-like protein [Acropora cervicornis]|uniref:Protein CDV3-like protein n=1 Tax=Acropora cervicornis TaxID=6130 RepID=A0AAD9VDF5_ACRCE|nr:Protein CDV3-like protein [Acropora cervicornis]